MNLHLSRVRSEWSAAFGLLLRSAANVFATLVIWLLLIGLLSCPVWLPLLVETLTAR